jgi:hypothetical protein
MEKSMKQKRNNSREMPTGWYGDCLLNSTQYFEEKLGIAIKDLALAYQGIADNKFLLIQIDAATKEGKKTFDSETFMKKAREDFLSKEHSRIKERISGINQYMKDSLPKDQNKRLLDDVRMEISMANILLSKMVIESSKLSLAKRILIGVHDTISAELENQNKVAQITKLDV